MLQITIPSIEQYNEDTGEFCKTKEQTLQLEHSLVSLSKWESKWCKPFLHTPNKTYAETLYYIKCMTLTQNVKPETYLRLTEENVKQIENYIQHPMSATTCPKIAGKPNREIVTAELIYYWMISFNIPEKFEKWHLNKLLKLIEVCNVKNQPKKAQPQSTTVLDQAALNAERRKKLNSKG